ncbi:hypothetical protein E2P62_13350 [Xanthomonas perforans]|nr:hypothetical protein E2P62_13350 [Xanthomonas perforans]
MERIGNNGCCQPSSALRAPSPASGRRQRTSLPGRSRLRKQRIPNPSRIPNPESRIPNPESRIPNPESRIPNPESRIPNPESRIPNPGP